MNKSPAALTPALLLCAFVALGAKAYAGDDANSGKPAAVDKEKKAVALFQESVEEYRAGRFQQAVDLLTSAYALEPEPVLLYNLARAYEGLGKLREAIDAYERYLTEAPGSKDQGAIEKRIETLQRQLADRERLEAENRRATRERRELLNREKRAAKPAPAPASSMSIAPWIVASAGGAVLANGAVFGVLSREREDAAGNEPVGVDAQDRLEEAKSYATVANASFAAGGALVLTGLIWGYFDWKSTRPAEADQSARPSVLLSTDQVELFLRF